MLTKEEAAQAGYAAVLSIVDVATRFTAFCAAEGQAALETVELIMTEWVPYFGVPKLLL